MEQTNIKLTECPRDAMQGIKQFIPTENKIAYINKLLKVGYYAIDFGSFVSHDVIPQMADTAKVLKGLELDENSASLIAIVANERGANDACAFDEIKYLGFPFSVSETFQIRNTHANINTALERVETIKTLADKSKKEVIIYISMGFGNPYNDPYSPEIVAQWVEKLSAFGIKTFMLSDTIGIGTPENISYLFSTLIPSRPDLEFGAHLHTAPHNWRVKIDAAYNNGCRRFDTAIKGYGGCPMAKDELIGNMPTENLINYFHAEKFGEKFNLNAFEAALRESSNVFPIGH
ncbi:MAG: hydroxymethylglutaryl-CoA lyase [Chitinophagales bacterium]|nr:hydroxymethylglutaryl-CoA lyase [Chitinophagales bacterium]MCO5280306.1 hydroxymethylglutaryl-CoA lyase [Chitinophagales bacterium]